MSNKKALYLIYFVILLNTQSSFALENFAQAFSTAQQSCISYQQSKRAKDPCNSSKHLKKYWSGNKENCIQALSSGQQTLCNNPEHLSSYYGYSRPNISNITCTQSNYTAVCPAPMICSVESGNGQLCGCNHTNKQCPAGYTCANSLCFRE